VGGGAESIAGAAALPWEDADDPWLEDALELAGMGFNPASVAGSTTCVLYRFLLLPLLFPLCFGGIPRYLSIRKTSYQNKKSS
jgi:hypothetical protein